MGSDNGEIFSFSLKTMKLTGSYLHSSSHHYLNSVNNNSPMHGVRQSLSNISNNMTDYSNSETDAKSINVTIIKTTPNDTFSFGLMYHRDQLYSYGIMYPKNNECLQL